MRAGEVLWPKATLAIPAQSSAAIVFAFMRESPRLSVTEIPATPS
jgi:hypothetical protein